MTRARFFLAAALVVPVSAAVSTSAMAQSAAPYAAAIDKAHVVAAGSSARTTETNRVQDKVAGVAAKPAPAAATAVSPAQALAEAPGPDAKGFAYNPEGRRDPFVSLMRRGNDETAQSVGPRKPGLPGLGVGEVTLKGTMASRGGYLGLIKGADSKTYIVRPGDRLLDGAIQAVTADAVVILQQVDDPLSPHKEREVRKTLRQTEEEAK